MRKVVELERTVAAQRDGIARLKGGPGRPNIKPSSKPSGMEQATDPKPPGRSNERQRRGGTRAKLCRGPEDLRQARQQLLELPRRTAQCPRRHRPAAAQPHPRQSPTALTATSFAPVTGYRRGQSWTPIHRHEPCSRGPNGAAGRSINASSRAKGKHYVCDWAPFLMAQHWLRAIAQEKAGLDQIHEPEIGAVKV